MKNLAHCVLFHGKKNKHMKMKRNKRKEILQRRLLLITTFLLLLLIGVLVEKIVAGRKSKIQAVSSETVATQWKTETEAVTEHVTEHEETQVTEETKPQETESQQTEQTPTATGPNGIYKLHMKPADPNNLTVCIDPGHQRYGDSTKEPNGPGSSTMKARVTGGATGVATGVPEYQLTLQIGLLLKSELESRGYTVVMTRETHDVNISNMERAQYATANNAEVTVRIHGNSINDSSVHGALTMAPSEGNPYVGEIAAPSYRLSKCILEHYCQTTGMRNRGVSITDTMTGINWCTSPVTIIEMGFMSNATDDCNMQDASYQSAMVCGIADGIDEYFGR